METGVASPGRVILAGAPLGNPADASRRFADALATAPLVAAEDTRRVRRLAADLGVTITGRIVSFFEGNELGRLPTLLDALRAGKDVLVVTDAGMPSVSDPGYRLVSAAVEAGIAVTVLPGPSAVTAALAVSGLPVDRFCFEGFLPRKAGDRYRRLAELSGETRTIVFFEAPHRLAASLADAATAIGPGRMAAVCRELSKTYEEVRRGPLSELARWAEGDVRGEITVVVAGAESAAHQISDADLAAAVSAAEADGMTRRDAIAAVAARFGVPRRRVYELVVSGS